MDVESRGSWPAMALRTTALSVTSFVIGPIWSRELAKATRPYRLTSPYVGLRPTTPHSAAGCLMLPPVSEPSEKRQLPAATAAAGPPLLPPGTRPRSHGFRVAPKAEFSVDEPMANSSRLPFPTSTASWPYSLAVTVAS